MRDGDAGVRGRRYSRGHAWNDLELHPGGAARLGLLAPAAEDERVAALQAHDAEPPLRPLDERLR